MDRRGGREERAAPALHHGRQPGPHARGAGALRAHVQRRLLPPLRPRRVGARRGAGLPGPRGGAGGAVASRRRHQSALGRVNRLRHPERLRGAAVGAPGRRLARRARVLLQRPHRGPPDDRCGLCGPRRGTVRGSARRGRGDSGPVRHELHGGAAAARAALPRAARPQRRVRRHPRDGGVHAGGARAHRPRGVPGPRAGAGRIRLGRGPRRRRETAEGRRPRLRRPATSSGGRACQSRRAAGA